ncbi:major facilitator superfamily transporter [Nitzschia inconspicua]|uniref:Major facilitator superfamily transporter n=1 Tax=Nitzschia inconspicua TaxID=303405 RepID=A0A9K3KFX6_9STRA|nr:major facilitator superfamily transporter [Nitzschia inconspicua]
MNSVTATSREVNSFVHEETLPLKSTDVHSYDTIEEDRLKGVTSILDESNDISTTYFQLLRDNVNYRYYWLSYVANHMGEWMTYLASISLIQDITLRNSIGNTTDRVNTLISILILVKLLPNVFFMPLGGVLADQYDRRKVQVTLDLTCSLLVLLFLTAAYCESIILLYLATFLQECFSGLYIPSNSAMLPMLANDSDSELQKATTLSGLTWSLMAAIGSSTGGLLVAVFGVQGCFMIDSLTYLISATLLAYRVEGTFVATEEEKKKQKKRASSITITRTTTNGCAVNNGGSDVFWTNAEFHAAIQHEEHQCIVDGGTDDDGDLTPEQQSQWSMFLYGLRFAFVDSPMVGCYALLKGTAALAFGATDVLNVSFSARGTEDNPSLTSFKLGALFGCVGIGCIIGSVLCDMLVALSRPLTIVRLCLTGFLLISLGCLTMGLFPDHFVCICLSGVVRSTGSSLVWINSVLLLQKYSPPILLGRVQSIDVASALLGEAISAMGGGLLMDNAGISPEQLSILLACISIGWFVFWSPFLACKTPKVPFSSDS